MKKILGLMVGILLTGANLYAGNGDLIVNGKLGIGDTGPSQKLHVSGGVALFDNYAAVSGADANSGLRIVAPIATSHYNWMIGAQQNVNAAIEFTPSTAVGGTTFSTPVMTILQNGNVGIGTTDPSFKLQLSTDSAAKPGRNTWDVPSDERLKSDIKPFKDGLSTILGINPVMYRYNGKGEIPESETDKDNIGVVAQEIQEVAPYTVGKFKAKLNKEDIEKTELLDFNSHALVFVLINAIKEQQKQITDQQKRIEDLEKKVSQVK